MGKDNNIIGRIALSMVKGLTVDIVRALPETGLSVDDFFNYEISQLCRTLNLSRNIKITDKDRKEALEIAKKEYQFVERHGIRVYSIIDEDYPWLLRQLPDAPIALYQLGDTDLNNEHTVSVVGTRRAKNYGYEFTKQFVSDLGGYFPDLCIISGLAYGIDSAAHSAAIDSNLTTVAVMAHGLDMIYPAQNRDLAKRILKSGGAIISEYPSGTTPYAGRFLERNRIVAGLSPLTVVVESEIKGGAMSTANFAFTYNRDVMALPGRISDVMSGGCNHLLRKEKAHLVAAAADVIELMDWRPLNVRIEPKQRNLFPELNGNSKRVYELLKFNSEPMSVDNLYNRTGISVPELLSVLTELEFDGIISKLPGNRYTIS